MFPHDLVGEVLLHVWQASDGFALHQGLAVGEAGVAQDGHPVAQGGGELARLIELGELGVQILSRGEGEHQARDEIRPGPLDALPWTGGEGPMFTFATAENLHAKFAEFL